ncbi:MAG: hypothetical protein Q9164_006514, partial [Protoblastenia rupestris]
INALSPINLQQRTNLNLEAASPERLKFPLPLMRWIILGQRVGRYPAYNGRWLRTVDSTFHTQAELLSKCISVGLFREHNSCAYDVTLWLMMVYRLTLLWVDQLVEPSEESKLPETARVFRRFVRMIWSQSSQVRLSNDLMIKRNELMDHYIGAISAENTKRTKEIVKGEFMPLRSMWNLALEGTYSTEVRTVWVRVCDDCYRIIAPENTKPGWKPNVRIEAMLSIDLACPTRNAGEGRRRAALESQLKALLAKGEQVKAMPDKCPHCASPLQMFTLIGGYLPEILTVWPHRSPFETPGGIPTGPFRIEYCRTRDTHAMPEDRPYRVTAMVMNWGSYHYYCYALVGNTWMKYSSEPRDKNGDVVLVDLEESLEAILKKEESTFRSKEKQRLQSGMKKRSVDVPDSEYLDEYRGVVMIICRSMSESSA